jgi:uncharacterized protein YegP (UPF0339 family)
MIEMANNAPPLIFVDLIEDAPKSKSAFAAEDYSGEDVYQLDEHYQHYLDTQFQPWRVLIKSGDNHKPLFRSTERYFNREDAIHAIQLAFGSGSDVYLREAEHGDVELRLASPATAS